MQNDYYIILISFLFIIIVFGIILFLIYLSPRYIRKIRMKKLATYFNLNFQNIVNPIRFEAIDSGITKRNQISGILNGKKIEIYDYFKYRTFEDPLCLNKRTYNTDFVINDKLNSNIFGVLNFVGVGEIKKWLDAVKSGKEYKISQNKKWFLDYFLIFVIFLIIFVLIYNFDF